MWAFVILYVLFTKQSMKTDGIPVSQSFTEVHKESNTQNKKKEWKINNVATVLKSLDV